MPVKKNKRESEKVIERKLNEYCKKKGGWALKLLPNFVRGVPDRLVLLPPGIIYFVELKSSDGRLSRAQELNHTRLRLMGFRVYVISSREELDLLEAKYDQFEQEVLAWRALEGDRKKAAKGRRQL